MSGHGIRNGHGSTSGPGFSDATVGAFTVERPDVLVMGFLPWTDEARGIRVAENPAALTAHAVSLRLQSESVAAAFVPVHVSAEGIQQAMQAVRESGAPLVVALGQTRRTPTVERMGRVPGDWAPAEPGEPQPWLLVPNPGGLVDELNQLIDPAALTEPFTVSDDAGGYFCDHLCVELARDSRKRGSRALFLHLSPTEGLPADVRDARLAQYERQVLRAAELAASGLACAA